MKELTSMQGRLNLTDDFWSFLKNGEALSGNTVTKRNSDTQTGWMISAPMFGIAVNPDTSAMSLMIGALFAGLTVSSLFGFLAKEWKEVKIVTIAEIVYLAVGLIAHIISFSAYEVGSAVLSFIVTIIFLVLFLLSYLQQEDIIKTLWK